MKDRFSTKTMIDEEVTKQRKTPHQSWPQNQNNISNLYILVSGFKFCFYFWQANLMIPNTSETASRVLKIIVF